MNLLSPILGVLFFFLSINNVYSQTFDDFKQNDICLEQENGQPAKINHWALIDFGTSKIPHSKLRNKETGEISRKAQIKYALSVDTNEGIAVATFILAPNNKFYEIRRIGGGDVSPEEYLSNPNLYIAICKNWPNSNQKQITAFRKKVDKGIKLFGKNTVIRKSVDAFGGEFEANSPATVAVTRDSLKKNTLVQTQIAAAQKYSFHLSELVTSDKESEKTIPVDLFPFITYNGSFNSKLKSKNVDNLGLGLRADILGLNFVDVIRGPLSLRAQYITDSEAKSEIALGEVVFSPRFTGSLDDLIPLQKSYWLLGHTEGPYLFMEGSARFRFGEVIDPGEKAFLQLTKQYQRVGGRFYAEMGFGGNDFLSGFFASVEYWHLNNLQDKNGIDDFEFFEAALNYDFTKNIGVTLSYSEGRNVDTLEMIDIIKGALTIKVGAFEN